ncbi:MAG: SHOCT domain-containing protein [Methanomassiliicoccus sp.]|nr:SHOCT domain-containing protein [Methanomassiliicoccus sp.]
MSQVYSRTVKAIGDVDAIYDRMWAAMKAQGFNLVTSEKPNLLIGDRGILRPTRKVSKYPHSLVVAFHSGESNPLVSFTYIMSDMWNYTPGDREFFNFEINTIVSSLNMNASFIDVKDAQDSPASSAYINELRGLAKLRDDGLISASEFDYKKRQLMGI